MEAHKELGYEKISTLLWKYSLPATIGTLVNALYNIVDRIYLGHGAGVYAIAGMAITFPIMNILGAFGMLVGQGAAAQMSLHLGKDDKGGANRILGNAVIMAFMIFAVVSTSFFVFLDEILIGFGATENTLPYAMDYMRIILPFHVITSLSFSGNNMMRASGFPSKAMFIMVAGAVLNVILDPIFIFTLGLGIKGAAISSVISMTISSILVMIHFAKQNNTIHFERGYFKIDWKIIISITTIGLAPFLLQIGTSMINLFMNHSLLKYGGDMAVGAFGIITSVALLVIMTIVGICQGSQPILGYNYSKRQYERVREILKITIMIGTILTSVSWAIFELVPSYIARCFGDNMELIEVTKTGMRIYMSVFFLVGSQVVISNYFQSIGRVKVSIFLSVSRQIIFLLPCIAILPLFWGITGVWLAQVVANILAFGVAVYCLRKHLKKMERNEL